MVHLRTGMICAIAGIVSAAASAASASNVSGSPTADGWAFVGHSLANGSYVRGNANYGFNMYSSVLTVGAGSNLHIADGANSWLPGDTVLGVGGVFTGITAGDAGWAAIGGNAVNSLLTVEHGPKLIVKFGTSAATFSDSTVAPGSGNGNGSTASGGVGGVFVRSSGWFHPTDPIASQDTDTTWAANAGMLMQLDKDNHISRNGTSAPDKNVARLIWNYDAGSSHPSSWQILLNVSLLDRTAPVGFMGLTPGPGDMAIASVQDRDSTFTDSILQVVPAPGAAALFTFAGLAAARRRRTR